MRLSAECVDEDIVPLWKERRPAYYGVTDSRHARGGSQYVYRRLNRCPPTRPIAKRIMDVVGASFALLFLAPLLIAIAIAIKVTSRGPVLFKQRRYGYHNHRFRIFKFRTMYVHLEDATGTRQTTKNDPRVTPLGRFLRNTSLDELPQLINVLIGDMSLVGPRPHVPGMQAAARLYEDLIPYYFHRHMMRPGITGLAQVSGCRGSTVQADAAMDRIDYDLAYIEQWSLWLDLRIILLTIRREMVGGNGD